MKRIRFRFIWISAAVLFVVLFCIIFGFNVANKLNVYNRNRETIQFIHNMVNTEQPFPNLPNDDPEERFRNRFFVSSYDENGKLLSIDITNVARINKEEATNISNQVYSTGSKEGTVSFYQYGAVETSGITKYVFLDVQDANISTNQVILVSSMVALGGYCVVLLLIIILSKLVIKPLEIADAKQKRFITDASHELKTPLTVINSNLEIIEMENGESEWVSSSKKQIENLTSMTNQLVLLSRLNEYDNKLSIEKVDVNAIIENSSIAYIPLLKRKDIELTINSASESIIQSDSNILSQLFNILFDNMYKYAMPGDANVTLEKNRNNLVIIFKNKYDTSIQIDPNSLFDRFYRGDASRGTSKGFGIGLSLAKSLVDLLKGKISVSINNDTISFKIIL